MISTYLTVVTGKSITTAKHMSDITVINDSEQSSLVTNGLAKNGELYLKAAGSTDAGAIVVYDSGSWRTFANEYSSGFANQYSVTLDGVDDQITGVNGSWGITGTSWTYCFRARWGTLPSSGYFNAFHAYIPTLIRVSSTYFRPYSSGGTNAVFYPSGGVVADKWYFLAVVQDGTSHSYYIKSSTDDLSQTKTGSSSSLINGPTIIGAGTSYVDELASFNSALSSSDIDAIYNSGTPIDLTSYSPASWWRMGDSDSGTGTSVSNEVSGGASLSLQNGAAFSTTLPS